MNDLQWLIQHDTATRNGARLHAACQATGVASQLLQLTDDQLPDAGAEAPVVLYGSCGFVRHAMQHGHWSPGAWSDAAVLSHGSYQRHFGEWMLNANARSGTLAEVVDQLRADERVFLRGDADDKALTGSLWWAGDLRTYVAKLELAQQHALLRLPVIWAPRQVIDREWRLFVVAGEVVTGSQYRRLGDLEVLPSVPDPVREFASRMLQLWSPLPVFAMDVAQVAAGLRVVELNGFNSSGFYGADIGALVRHVRQWWRSGEPGVH